MPPPRPSAHRLSAACPFAHLGERAARRDPRCYNYTGIACVSMKQVESPGRSFLCLLKTHLGGRPAWLDESPAAAPASNRAHLAVRLRCGHRRMASARWATTAATRTPPGVSRCLSWQSRSAAVAQHGRRSALQRLAAACCCSSNPLLTPVLPPLCVPQSIGCTPHATTPRSASRAWAATARWGRCQRTPCLTLPSSWPACSDCLPHPTDAWPRVLIGRVQTVADLESCAVLCSATAADLLLRPQARGAAQAAGEARVVHQSCSSPAVHPAGPAQRLSAGTLWTLHLFRSSLLTA